MGPLSASTSAVNRRTPAVRPSRGQVLEQEGADPVAVQASATRNATSASSPSTLGGGQADQRAVLPEPQPEHEPASRRSITWST